MKNRYKEIIFDCVSHFLEDGWDLNINQDSYINLGPYKKSDFTKEGRARLARLMPYLILRKEGKDVWLVKNFEQESEIPAEHLLVYYKQLAEVNREEADKLYNSLYNAAEKAGIL